MKYQPHVAAVERAEKLIATGAVNLSDPWSFEERDRKLVLGERPNWPGFAAYHLGQSPQAAKNTETTWHYPFGKDGIVYRSALRAAQLQAFKNGDSEIAHTARDLIAKIDKVERRPWYEMKNDADEASAEIFIFDEIGVWGITAKDFIDDFKALKESKQITLHINSPGGAAFDGLAIFNLLNRADAHITTVIDGVAASIASVIAMAGDEIVMPENAFMFVHNPMGGAWGYSEDLRSVADTLDKMKKGVMTAYRRSGLKDDAISDLMDEQTWLSAQEAIDLGLADRLEAPVKISANFDLSRFLHVPDALLMGDAERTGTPDVKRDPVPAQGAEEEVTAEVASPDSDHAAIAAACTEAGLPALIAPAIEKGTTLAEIHARLEEAKSIRTLCGLAKHPELVDGFIAAGYTQAHVRERLFDLLVAEDRRAQIDTSLPIDATHVHIPPPPKHANSWARAFQSINGGRSK